MGTMGRNVCKKLHADPKSCIVNSLSQMRKYGYKVVSLFYTWNNHEPLRQNGIHMGLALYSLGMYLSIHRSPLPPTNVTLPGAIFFWPSAKFEKYGGFVGCTFVIGCGIATLEVAANSYISVLGTPKYAAARLNFSQGFQGVALFSGPLIASRWFFLGENATTLATVQWSVPTAMSKLVKVLNKILRVYLAVAGLGVALNVMFQ